MYVPKFGRFAFLETKSIVIINIFNRETETSFVNLNKSQIVFQHSFKRNFVKFRVKLIQVSSVIPKIVCFFYSFLIFIGDSRF